jgi:hypothetical protein
MIEYFILNVGVVQLGQPFRRPEGGQYNAGWLAGATEEDKAAIGAVLVQRQAKPQYDPRIERLVESEPGPVITYQVEPLPAGVIDAAMLAHLRAASEAIDAAAEQARARFITSGSGQAMVYQAKTAEAAAWLAANSPADLTGYPFIAAEVGITMPTAAELVALWQAMEAGWRQAAALIEAARMGGKIAVEQAADFDAVDTARNQAITTLALITPPEE